MESVLIHLQPWNSATGQRVDVYIADAAVAEAYGINGTMWEPAVRVRPELSIQLFDHDMTGRVQLGRTSFELALSQIESVANPHLLYWTGAPVSIYTVEELAWQRRSVEFIGRVSKADPDKLDMTLRIDGEVDIKPIEKPLLRLEFDGGGGLGGDGGKRGVLKPAGFGTVFNIEPVWFDLTDNIGMIDGYGNCLTIPWLGEGRSSTGFQFVANYPTYAALKAAIAGGAVGKGQWATCIADGCVGLGAPPEGRITVDATFGAGTGGAWMKRILLTHAQLDPAKLHADAFDALDAMVPFPTGAWFGEQRQIPDLLTAIAVSCNATPLVNFQGHVTVTRAVKTAPVLTLDYSGSVDPRVTKTKSIENPEPYYRMRARTARPATVFQFTEINFIDTIDDTNGLWKVGETYRGGDVVWRPDGSSFLYINDVPAAGQVPPAGTVPPAAPAANAYWQQLLPPATYADGTPLEALKPAQLGANVTQTNTAAAIVGQGSLATLSKVALGTSGQVYRQDGTTPLTDLVAVTSMGTAAAIAGQGALATLAQVNLGTSGRVYRDDGVTRLTDALAVTSVGTAAAIAGQGALATAMTADFNSQVSGSEKPANYAGTSVVFSTVGSNVAVRGNSVWLTTLAAGMGQGVYTKMPQRRSAHLSFRPVVGTYSHIWLSTNVVHPTGGAPWNDAGAIIAFACTEAGNYFGWTPAAGLVGMGSFNAGDVFELDYNGVRAGVSRNGVPYLTTAAGSGLTLYGRLILGSANTAVTDILWEPLGDIVTYRDDGATKLTQLELRTAEGTAAAIAGQGALATLSLANMDTHVVDGATYVRPKASAFTAGVPKLQINGSGVRVGGPRNLPPINAMNLGYKFTGAVTYSAASSGSATISVAAGSALIGATSPTYSAMAAVVSGTPGTTVTYYLYVEEGADTSTWGGSKTLVATTNGDVVYSSDNRMWIGVCPVFFPTTGTSTGGGSGGGGGGSRDISMPEP